METKKQYLIVKNIIGSDLAVSSDDGKKVYQAIFEALRREAIVELDFQGITVVITAFLNMAIGKLYQDFNGDFLNAHLKLVNVDDKDKALFKMVVTYAKEYFANQEAFEQAVEEIL